MISQRNYFTETEVTALKLLQEFLHHKKLKVKAASTTLHRIQKLKQKEHITEDFEKALENAATIINQWVFINSKALWAVVTSVIRKYPTLLNSGYITKEDIFHILFIESVRILYNYDFTSGVKPLTYLISVLHIRKVSLVPLDIPYSDSISLIQQVIVYQTESEQVEED